MLLKNLPRCFGICELELIRKKNNENFNGIRKWSKINATFFKFKISTFNSKNFSRAFRLSLSFNWRESLSPRPVTRSAKVARRFSVSIISLSPRSRSLMPSKTADSTYSWKISLHAYRSLLFLPPGTIELENGDSNGVAMD